MRKYALQKTAWIISHEKDVSGIWIPVFQSEKIVAMKQLCVHASVSRPLGST